jgi:hypothetical protein
MSTTERKPRRTLDQEFIDGAVKLVAQEGYKNPRDRATYPWRNRPHRYSHGTFRGPSRWSSHVLGNGGGRWNTGSKDSYPDRSTNPTEKCRGATIANLQQATTKRKNPWIRKEPKGFR